MPNYIDRDSVLDRLRVLDSNHADPRANEHFIFGIETAIEVIESEPSLKLVAGVRCGKCRWYSKGERICFHPSSIYLNVSENFYCGYGKKIREEKANDKRMSNET